MKNIRLGVGIPTINRYDLLKESLLTLLPQSDDFEHLVVVDNGNQNIKIDNSKTTVISNKSNKGVSGSWNQIINTLIDEHKVTHVLMLNDDIVLHSDQIKTIKEQIKKHPEKWMLIGNFAWSVWVFNIKHLDKLEYEPRKYFDESFFPAYFEDNDFHYRLKLASPGMDKTISLNQLGPKVKRGSMSIGKDRNLLKGSNNCGYYVSKWGGTPGKEKFKTPFNKPIINIPKLKECFVIYGKTYACLNTIESVRNLYPEAKILFVPSTKNKLLSNLFFSPTYNIETCKVENTCMTTAIFSALDNIDEEYFYFLNEYVILKKRIDKTKAYPVCSVANFGGGFDNDKQINWLKKQCKEHCPIINIDNHKWNGVFASMSCISKEALLHVKESGFMNIIPTNENESQAMERGWGALFEALGYDHVTGSICGDYFKFLPKSQNEFLEMRITGNGG